MFAPASLLDFKIYGSNNSSTNNSINNKDFSPIHFAVTWMCPLVKVIMIVGNTFLGMCVLSCYGMLQSWKV